MKSKNPDLMYHVWATAWGPVGAVAGGDGLVRFVLPHYTSDDLVQLLAWEHKGAQRAGEPFTRLIELTRKYFNAQSVDFGEIECALPAKGSFSHLVLQGCREIAFGKTMSYSALAMKIGREDAARAVATALGKNPIPLIIPCHRVTYSDGSPGGFSAEGGVALKQRMLSMESAAN